MTQQRRVSPPTTPAPPVQTQARPKSDAAPQTLPATEEDVLDELESLLIRMLIGTIKFPLVYVPRWIYRALRRLFPTMVRGLRVCFLAAVLFVTAIGPAAFAFFVTSSGGQLAVPGLSSSMAAFLEDSPVAFIWCCYAWSILATAGAIWGALYVRRKRRGM